MSHERQSSLELTRREALTLIAGASAAALHSTAADARVVMPTRRIPSSGEPLPVIGLGSSKVVEEIAKNGEGPVREVLKALAAHGGKVIDTWPRNPANDDRFGAVINEPALAGTLFVTTKIDKVGKDAGLRSSGRPCSRTARRPSTSSRSSASPISRRTGPA